MDIVTWIFVSLYLVWIALSIARSMPAIRRSNSYASFLVSSIEFALRYTAVPIYVGITLVSAAARGPVPFALVVLFSAMVVSIAYNQTRLRDRNYWFHGRYSDGQDPWFVRVLRPKTEVSDA